MKFLALAALALVALTASAGAQNIQDPAPAGAAGAYNVSPPACADGHWCALQTDNLGNLKVSGGGGGGPSTIADCADTAEGCIGDTAWTTGNGTVISILKNIASSTAGSITNWGGGVLGAMANYGTSPGAVLVPGMNAFLTGAANFATAGTAVPATLAAVGISDNGTSCSGGPCLVAPSALVPGVFGSPTAQVLSVQANDPCTYAAKSSAAIAVATATTTSLVAVSGSTSIYVCGFSMTIAPSATAADTALFEYGTSTNCTGTHALTGTYGAGDLTSAAPVTHVNYGTGGYTVMTAPASQGVCIVTAGTAVSVQGILTYVQQ